MNNLIQRQQTLPIALPLVSPTSFHSRRSTTMPSVPCARTDAPHTGRARSEVEDAIRARTEGGLGGCP